MLEIAKLAAGVAAPLATGALAAEALSADKVAFVAYLAAVVVAVVAVVAWVRTQVKSEIRTHSAQDRQRHRLVLAEIRHVRELLAVKFGLPAPEPVPADLEDEEA
jgi:uncharacterized membrane protein (DUF441 family)